MTAGLTVPVLAAGPFRLRPFMLDDLDAMLLSDLDGTGEGQS